jgi:hypothetical protein
MLLYADEDFPFPAVEELRRFGHDVLTAQDDGRTAAPDPDVLARAHALGRAILPTTVAIMSDCIGKVFRTTAYFPPNRTRTIWP